MKDNRTKELVMKNIREALIDKNEVADCEAQPAPGTTFVQNDHDDLSVLFAKNFTRAGGSLFYCYNEADIGKHILEIQHQHSDTPIACLSENLTNFISHLGVSNCHTTSPTNQSNLGASLCEALLAWQGSIVVSSNLGLGITQPSLSDTTIFLAFTSQVVSDWEIANQRIKQLYPAYPDQIFITNPAAYAYQKGLQKLYLILIEDETN